MTSQSPEIGKTLNVDGVRINYHDQGQGDAVLLIHGSGPGVTAWANWRTILPVLAQTHRVIAPDMAGFGYTETPQGFDATPETWVRQVIGLLDALGLEKVTIIGNSFGGAIALKTASLHPGRVERLVLMGSAGTTFPITAGLQKVWGYQPSLEAMKELLDIFVHDHSILTDDLAEMRYRASIRADVQERFAALFPEPRQDGVNLLALSDAELAAIEVPAAVIHGRDDQVIPFSVSEALVRKLPNAVLHAIEACGHWVQIEKTQEFLEIVTGFLGVSGAAQTGGKEKTGMEGRGIEGRWNVVSWRQDYDDGRVVLPMGDKLNGFVQYHEGRVVVMVADATRPNFTTGGQWDASTDEKARAYETGLFYAGPYRVEGEHVFHEIEIASVPNWVGGTQKRRVALDGDSLKLTARLEDGTPEARTAVLEWRRIA